MAFTSLGVVLVSTLTFVLGTFPEFQSFAESGTPEEYPEVELVSNELNHFGGIASFFQDWALGTCQCPRCPISENFLAKLSALFWHCESLVHGKIYLVHFPTKIFGF